MNAQACDSIITINLTINSNTASSISETACLQYTSPSGKFIYSESGNYNDTLPNSKGCDSVITINLTINTVDISVVTDSRVLTANNNANSYQWIDCSTNNIIDGETNQTYMPSANGNYAVIMTQNGCTDTSDCYEISAVGITQQNNSKISVFPNPTNGNISIELGQVYAKVNISLTNIHGQTQRSWNFENVDHLNLVIEEAPGLYFINVTVGKESTVFRIVKE